METEIPIDLIRIDGKPISQNSQPNYWQSNSYSSLLSHQQLNRSIKRNLWGYELRSMLNRFMSDIHEYKRELKFKVSGKILNSSTYVLKSKSNQIINTSLETQEDIKEVQTVEIEENDVASDDLIEYEVNSDNIYDDEDELFKAFTELDVENLLSEAQKASFKEEKIKRALNLEIFELNDKIKDKIKLIKAPPKLLYKKVGLKDLANALNEVLKAKDTLNKIRKPKKRTTIDKSKLSFLPEKFIVNAEKRRADFEKRINLFYETLKNQYIGEPIPFLKLVTQPTAKALVDTLLIILHLINHKRIEIWKPFIEENDKLKEVNSEDNGTNIYFSPF